MSALKDCWKVWRRERREVREAWREAGVGIWGVAVALVALSVGSGDGCSTSRFEAAKGLLSVCIESASASSSSL